MGSRLNLNRRKRALSFESLEARLAPAANPIVAENLLPGNPQSQWDIVGSGDPTLQGYATDISVDQGQTVSFKIDDQTSAPYRIEIYRIGYYQGNGARLVATIPSSATLRQVQAAPLKDLTTGLTDAGNWAVSASWAVPSTAVSGVYIAKLVREDTGGASHIPFVVRDDDGQSDVIMQTADTTWQAYNNWGGYSLYSAPTAGTSANPNSLPRGYKVSYNRPFNTRGIPAGGSLGYSGSYSWFFHSEYPLVRFMEANGYNVSYTTDVDTDRRGAELLEHKLFVSMGHDEYWSGAQRANVEAARDAGVNLAFFTGNEVYWKTRWETSTEGSNTPYRTLVSYKETKANAKIDPSSTWTGTWRDMRFSPPYDGGRPENQLIGNMYMVDQTSAYEGISLQVPANEGKLWFWRNTPVAGLAPGQVATIGDRVIGFEANEDLDNGFRPAGLMGLSSTTFQTNNRVTLPWGGGSAPGTSTHKLTLYRAPSGALVFGAGSINYAFGLDGVHDNGNSTPDQSIRQSTVNLFADMGIQPDSIQSGLFRATMNTDLTRPTSSITVSSVPTSVVQGTPVTISGTAADTGGGVVGGVEVSTDGGLTWHPAVGRATWTYTFTPTAPGVLSIKTRAVDDRANVEIPTGGASMTVTLPVTSANGLVAAYAFNSAADAAISDQSGDGNNATGTNVTSAAGIFGNAFSFNGTNSWVTIPDNNSLDLTTGMTLEAWVKPTASGGYRTVFFKEKPGDGVYSMYSTNVDFPGPASYIALNNGGSGMADGADALPLNAWSHLTTTYDGSLLNLYVNGNLVKSRSAPGAIATSAGALRIGGNSLFGEYFAGLIDEVRVYNRALSPGEILSDMNTPIGGTVETTAPTGSVTNTAGTVSGVVTLTATASDNVPVAPVQFLLTGQPVGVEDTTAPYSYAWDTTKVANGTYAVSVRVRDLAGNTTTSAAVNLTVANSADTTPPTSKITNPSSGMTIGGTVILSAVATDALGVAGVQFKVNGSNVGSEVTTAPYRVAWNTAGLAGGDYTITAVARDQAGNLTTSAAVVVHVDTTAPTVTNKTPAAGATGVPTDSNVTVTFSESILANTLTFTLVDASGSPIATTMSYNDATKTATLFHSTSLSPGAMYTASVSGATDVAGNPMGAAVTWSFTTDSHITGANIWPDNAVPTNPAGADASAIEVGVKFRSALAGSVLGVRFYKGTGNTGTHVGHLWTTSGTLLGSVTFTGETGTGWQEALFSAPIDIQANTTYVASYYAPNGHYAGDGGYFLSGGVDGYPLRALSSAEAGGNGVYKYGTGGGFPDQTYNGGNYWVDVTFSTSAQDTAPPTVTARTPGAGVTGVPSGATVKATFSEPVQGGTIVFTLKDASGTTVPSSVSYDAATWTATLTPNAPLSAGATYTATVSGAKDAAGNTMTAADSWSFTVGAASTGATIWDNTATPAILADSDANPIELGLKFRSSTAGYITGLRFYKGTGNAGTHIGHLWTASGTLLGTATFSQETDTGWQEVQFSSPIAISANTTYVASYYAPNGHYSATSGYFASSGFSHGDLQALSSAEAGGNGVYKYGTGGGFPDQTYNGGNYWVDVTFSSAGQDTAAPTVAARTPAAGATGVIGNATVKVTFSEPIQSSSLTFTLTDGNGAVVPASVSYDSTTWVATLTPSAPLTPSTTYTATVSGAKDASGNTMTADSWQFTTLSPVTNASLWADSVVPNNPADPDGSAIELGVKFYSDVAGVITGIRFYKGAGNTGTHVGHLWALDGTLLGTATFSQESATGWQQVSFATPVNIQANTNYVASYYAPNGHYAGDANYFKTAGVDRGVLHALADGANGGNGLYLYGTGGGFPGNSYSSSNYYVDVVFSQPANDTTAPSITASSPANGATGVLSSAGIAVTFNEAVVPSTVAFDVRDTGNNLVSGNLNYDGTTRTATFIPSTPLLAFMTYTVKVTGAKDLSGNTMAGTYQFTFTTRGTLVHTSAADFGSGTNDGTLVTDKSGGEIQLAPVLNEEFTGTSLNATNWTSNSWTPIGGGATVINFAFGSLALGGAEILSNQSFANTGVEARLDFGGQPWRHFGLATELDTTAGNYWAIFSTRGTTDRLYARVNANGITTDVDIGALGSGYHTYLVRPTANGFDFVVDGELRTSVAASFQTSTPMKAAMSDFNASQPLFLADWVRFLNYNTNQTGTFTSSVFDAGQTVEWDSASWTAHLPAGTSVKVEMMSSVDGTNWSSWFEIGTSGSDSNSPNGRYMKYRIMLATTNATTTPVVKDITFLWR